MIERSRRTLSGSAEGFRFAQPEFEQFPDGEHTRGRQPPVAELLLELVQPIVREPPAIEAAELEARDQPPRLPIVSGVADRAAVQAPQRDQEIARELELRPLRSLARVLVQPGRRKQPELAWIAALCAVAAAAFDHRPQRLTRPQTSHGPRRPKSPPEYDLANVASASASFQSSGCSSASGVFNP